MQVLFSNWGILAFFGQHTEPVGILRRKSVLGQKNKRRTNVLRLMEEEKEERC